MGPASTSDTASQDFSNIVREYCVRNLDESSAAAFDIDLDGLAVIVSRVVKKAAPTAQNDCSRLLESLKLQELVLAQACAAGNERAWEEFMARYREALFSAAYKVAGNDATGRELADSIYAELYGVSGKSEDRRSKLLYYHGRGSLEGWLRTVIAQEHVNRYRRTRHESSLEEQVEAGKQFAAAPPADTSGPDSRIDVATREALARLPADDRLLLAAYFIDGRTLAEIAKLLCVHESTISRRLQRLAAGLRQSVEERLRAAGMTARQVQEAMENVDVRDLNVHVVETLRQEKPDAAFYKGERP